jgi:hypothetical protein
LADLLSILVLAAELETPVEENGVVVPEQEVRVSIALLKHIFGVGRIGLIVITMVWVMVDVLVIFLVVVDRVMFLSLELVGVCGMVEGWVVVVRVGIMHARGEVVVGCAESIAEETGGGVLLGIWRMVAFRLCKVIALSGG